MNHGASRRVIVARHASAPTQPITECQKSEHTSNLPEVVTVTEQA